MKSIIAVTSILVAGGIGYALWPTTLQTTQSDAYISLENGVLAVALVTETLSQNAQIGELGFEAKGAVFQGVNAADQDGVAPPLVPIIYEPSHHGDERFQRAVAMGVLGHHWPFGDMPPVGGITRADVKMITVYIRELQLANGIN